MRRVDCFDAIGLLGFIATVGCAALILAIGNDHANCESNLGATVSPPPPLLSATVISSSPPPEAPSPAPSPPSPLPSPPSPAPPSPPAPFAPPPATQPLPPTLPGQPAVPDQCSPSQCTDIRRLLGQWRRLAAQQYATGDVNFEDFAEAVQDIQVLSDAQATLATELSNDINNRIRALNNTIDTPGASFTSAQLARSEPLSLRQICLGARDRYYPLQALSWIMRNLDLECVMQYEMLVGGSSTPSQAWQVALRDVALFEIADSMRSTFSTFAPILLAFMSRRQYVDSMCTIPVPGGACDSTVADLMRTLLADVLAVIVPLRAFVREQGDLVWANGAHSGASRAITCNHNACCQGTGILFSPPGLPPLLPGAAQPPPVPPVTPSPLFPLPSECCACTAEPPPLASPPPQLPHPPPLASPPPPNPPPPPCDGTGLGGRTCSRCATDTGCSQLMSGAGRCDAGISAATWAPGEAHKGLSCQTTDNALNVDIGCAINGGASGWGDGSGASGECTAKALYGTSTHVLCSINRCTFRTGTSGAFCGNISCAQDLTAPGAVPAEDVAAFAGGLTGALEVSCVALDVASQTVRCEVSLGALAVPADCSVSRCITASAPATPDYDPNNLARDIPAECAQRLADGFYALAFGVAGVAVGIILLIVGACSAGMNQPSMGDRAAPMVRSLSRRMSGATVDVTLQKASTAAVVEEGSATAEDPDGSVLALSRSDLGSTKTFAETSEVEVEMASRAPAPPQSPQKFKDALDDLCKLVQQIRPLDQPAQLKWSELSVTARRWGVNGPQIVKPVSGALCEGCTALMGPSGSGKTTLLHAVTGLPHAGMARRGSVTLDDVEVSALPRGVMSLVPQDAVLPEELSAREALMFASALGLRHVSKADRNALVMAILDQLRISHVAHLPIGGRLAGRSGLSGGERKRVSVGVSIATCPEVILLDEPSSGLDAYAALELARLLQTIAKRTNRTILVSVHQPSSQLFELFDGLLLLAKGRRLYHGPPMNAVAHLCSLGAPVAEPGVAPADHLLIVLVTHVETLEDDKKTDSFGDTRASQQAARAPRKTDNGMLACLMCPCSSLVEAKWLGWRCIAQLVREPSLVCTQLAVHLLVALFMGGVFFQVESDIAGFQNKAGSISFLLYFFALGGLSTSQTVTREWPLLWAEYHQGLYGAIPYAVTRLLLELTLLRVLPAVAFSGIFYAMMGLTREILPFARFLLAAALASADSALLCAAIAALMPTQPGAASLVATVVLLGCLLVAGFNLNLTALPGWIEWLAWVSFGRHAFEIMLCSELEGGMVDVDVPGSPPVRIRAEIILGALGLDPERASSNYVALFLILVVLVVVTAVIVLSHMVCAGRRCRCA